MVDFKLTEDQLEMQNLFRKFAQEQILPIAEEMDEKEEMNMDMVKQMMELGFFGVPFSEEVGGTGMDYLTYCLLMEEVESLFILLFALRSLSSTLLPSRKRNGFVPSWTAARSAASV